MYFKFYLQMCNSLGYYILDKKETQDRTGVRISPSHLTEAQQEGSSEMPLCCGGGATEKNSVHNRRGGPGRPAVRQTLRIPIEAEFCFVASSISRKSHLRQRNGAARHVAARPRAKEGIEPVPHPRGRFGIHCLALAVFTDASGSAGRKEFGIWDQFDAFGRKTREKLCATFMYRKCTGKGKITGKKETRNGKCVGMSKEV